MRRHLTRQHEKKPKDRERAELSVEQKNSEKVKKIAKLRENAACKMHKIATRGINNRGDHYQPNDQRR